MVVLIATLQAKPGKEQELETALKSVLPQVETEQGTVQYILHRSEKQTGKFMFYEKYTDKAALNHHSTTPYLKELFAAIPALLAEKPVIELYEDIAAIKR